MRLVTASGTTAVRGEIHSWNLSYPMVESDGGRNNSKRPRQHNDCTVRAAALILGEDYDTIYDSMKVNGRRSGRRFNILIWIVGSSIGRGRFRKLSFPAEKGKPRMNIAKFCDSFRSGRYIIRTAKHVIAVIDGVVYDTFENPPDRCVYLAWELVK